MQAIEYRIDKFADQSDRDKQLIQPLLVYWTAILEKSDQQGDALNSFVEQDEHLAQLRWMIEEFRVSLFAQHLKTKVPVSDKRLKELWDQPTI